MRSIWLLPLILALSAAIRVIPTGDQVTSLDGWPDFTENKIVMYSGYLTTNSSTKASDGSIHYTFLESFNNASKDPVILWLNGGPGCSSLFGLFEEIGPYLYNGTWNKNEFTWLQNASILVFETPFGVGFSYNTTTVNYNDNDTALYNYNALLNWFQNFPEFKSLDFWIAGESYAGVYIPFLASLILNNNQSNGINLKGIMAGNPVMLNDDIFNNNTMLAYLVSHNLFSPQLVNILENSCPSDPESASCQYAVQQIKSILKRINPYDIYGYCSYAQTGSKPFPYYVNFLKTEEEIPLRDTNSMSCLSNAALETYLSNTTNQQSLHISSPSPSTWKDCNDTINQNYTRFAPGSLPFYPQFMEAKLKILVYSGDTDAVVSFVNTQRAIGQLGLNLINGWRTWHISNGQVGGYITEYDGLNYTVVRGAGHMVPQSQKEAAYRMFLNTVNGNSFP